MQNFQLLNQFQEKIKKLKLESQLMEVLEHGRLTIFSSENKVQIYNNDFDITVGENERIEMVRKLLLVQLL